MDGAAAMSEGRSNFIEILEQLDPLPDLPDAGEDRFFSKEALDYQWAMAPAENPPFPTWGSTGAEMAAIGAAAAANAMTPLPSAPSISGGKRPLPESSQQLVPPPPQPPQPPQNQHHQQHQQHQQHQRRTTVPADRMVFLRQRLGGESVSSGNSSTSTCSDTASDDVAGEWEPGSATTSPGGGSTSSASAAAGRTKSFVHGSSAAFARGTGGPGGGTGGGVGVSAAATAVATGAAAAGAAASAAASPTASKKAARGRRRSASKSKGRYSKSGRAAKRQSTATCGGSSAASGGGGGGYASWDVLVKPFKQQWDHVEPPTAGPSTGGAFPAASPPASGGVCSRFSPVLEPKDPTAFSVEQCSAQAHPTAVASYVMRVRCAGGAHIVRRTWDDIVSLCTMLGRDRSLSAGVAGGTRAASTTTSSSSVGVEFAPADVLSRDAASGFLKDLLARPGIAGATPARRFLELEFLDGTMRGGLGDDGRERTARHVAFVAAAHASASAAAASETPGSLAVEGDVASEAPQVPAMAASSASPTAGGLKVAVPLLGSAAVVPQALLGLPAHPDAARDLAAVCRCLGRLGAAAFTSSPRGAGAAAAAAAATATAPYWASREDGALAGGVSTQRGMAVLA